MKLKLENYTMKIMLLHECLMDFACVVCIKSDEFK